MKPQRSEKSAKNGTTAVMPCQCQHEFQDERYGAGKRLKVYQHDGGSDAGWHCTACGRR